MVFLDNFRAETTKFGLYFFKDYQLDLCKDSDSISNNLTPELFCVARRAPEGSPAFFCRSVPPELLQ